MPWSFFSSKNITARFFTLPFHSTANFFYVSVPEEPRAKIVSLVTREDLNEKIKNKR